MANGCGSKCFDCIRAITGCSWIDWQEPIKGWNAEPITIYNHNGKNRIEVDSYIVKACPLFKADSIRITATVMAIAFNKHRITIQHRSAYYKELFIEKYGEQAKQAGVRLVFGGMER